MDDHVLNAYADICRQCESFYYPKEHIFINGTFPSFLGITFSLLISVLAIVCMLYVICLMYDVMAQNAFDVFLVKKYGTKANTHTHTVYAHTNLSVCLFAIAKFLVSR